MKDGRVSNLAQIASLRRYTLTEGPGKGLDVIDCDNGKLRFLLNVTKALDIMQLYHGGQNVSFLSKNAFIAQNLPFLNRFEGGMLYTCGLDAVGGMDGHEIHGTFHNTVAEVTRATVDEEGIVVEAVVRKTALFGQNLVVKRRITSAVGSNAVTLEDTLLNEGYADEEYCLLYHVNVGYPMLDDGGRIEADVISSTPRTAWAERWADERYGITAPTPGMEETCYFLRLKKKEVAYINEKLGKKFILSFEGDALTDFVEWKSMASGDYALGLEPTTTVLDDGFRYKTVKAGASEKFRLTFRVE